ncbi:uncharacterized protein DSM5745_08878 [Aspergillus mulundensis]|uniref:Uncharacterized protein n=1 Tax=Aspergillus mulundensis TaxID=1810919 RepID=A0A3D8R574_9EURO|nr:hypothetical protein DSM5745_08878 [Aspergillus mulundensis]RDW69118.1 hypothetical protein DSM5745_08878 [Aspergillus mulundensis]
MTSLLSLPREILLEIADCLRADELHCYRFRNIHLTIIGEEQMLENLEYWDSVLERTQSFPFVQRLSIHCAADAGGPLPESDDGFLEVLENDIYKQCLPDEDEWARFGELYLWMCAMYGRRIPPQPSLALDDVWEPLADFLKKLLGLEDVLWIGIAQFPACLLEVLHKDIPTCRLHLRDCFPNVDGDGGIDEYDRILATSPSLSSIVTGVSHGIYEYKQQAIMQLAAGAAPNLTQVYFHYDNSGSPEGRHGPLPPEVNWFGDSPDKAASPLRMLGLHQSSFDDMTPDELDYWSNYVSFENLRVLQLHTFGNEFLLINAPGYKFPSLKTLSLDLRICRDNIEDRQDIVLMTDGFASDFVSSLPPLESFCLSGTYVEETLLAAMLNHGSSLQRLGLVPLDSQDKFRWKITPEIFQLVDRAFPNLCSLTVRIQRSQGDKNEVNIYKALSRIERLTIELDSALRSSRNPYGTENVLDFMVNLAVDETLVRSILAILTQESPSSSSRLQFLKVIPLISGEVADAWRYVALRLHKIWELRRFIYSDGFYLTRASRQSNGDQYMYLEFDLEELKGLFRELWPASGEDEELEWHSFPLEND